jgi:hypothetical protein
VLHDSVDIVRLDFGGEQRFAEILIVGGDVALAPVDRDLGHLDAGRILQVHRSQAIFPFRLRQHRQALQAGRGDAGGGGLQPFGLRPRGAVYTPGPGLPDDGVDGRPVGGGQPVADGDQPAQPVAGHPVGVRRVQQGGRRRPAHLGRGVQQQQDGGFAQGRARRYRHMPDHERRHILRQGERGLRQHGDEFERIVGGEIGDLVEQAVEIAFGRNRVGQDILGDPVLDRLVQFRVHRQIGVLVADRDFRPQFMRNAILSAQRQQMGVQIFQRLARFIGPGIDLEANRLERQVEQHAVGGKQHRIAIAVGLGLPDQSVQDGSGRFGMSVEETERAVVQMQSGAAGNLAGDPSGQGGNGLVVGHRGMFLPFFVHAGMPRRFSTPLRGDPGNGNRGAVNLKCGGPVLETVFRA